MDVRRTAHLTVADVATIPGASGYVHMDQGLVFQGVLRGFGTPTPSRVGCNPHGMAWITSDGQVFAQRIQIVHDDPPARWLAAIPGTEPDDPEPRGIYADSIAAPSSEEEATIRATDQPAQRYHLSRELLKDVRRDEARRPMGRRI
jgi:hypothetical protein